MSQQPPKDQYIEVGNIRTRCWSVGDGKFSAILVHGLGGYIENWEDNVAALAQVRRVYALDLVGFGRSDKPPPFGRQRVPSKKRNRNKAC